MKGRGLKRRVLLQGGSIALMLGVHQIARGATILAVRVWPAADYTRVTIESDARLSSQQLVVGSPPRLAVDIEGIELSPELRELVGKIKPGDPYINGLRVGQFAPSVVRIVFDLKQTVAPRAISCVPSSRARLPPCSSSARRFRPSCFMQSPRAGACRAQCSPAGSRCGYRRSSLLF